MKISKLACAASATAILLAPSLGLTEGKISVDATPSAVARINLAVVIPKVVALKVGASGATIDTLTFNGINVDVGATTITGSGNNWDGTAPTFPNGGAAQTLGVRVFSNGGDVTINQTDATSGNLVGVTPANTIPLTDITVTGVSITAPTAGSPSTTVTATNGIVNATDTWSYNFSASTTYAAGTYSAQLTYTATVL
jgi:hypothetical protein